MVKEAECGMSGQEQYAQEHVRAGRKRPVGVAKGRFVVDWV
jgi:hypothetical protein